MDKIQLPEPLKLELDFFLSDTTRAFRTFRAAPAGSEFASVTGKLSSQSLSLRAPDPQARYVDLYYINVLVLGRGLAQEAKDRFISIVRKDPNLVSVIASGPSYPMLNSILGDLLLTFRFMAYGAAAGHWVPVAAHGLLMADFDCSKLLNEGMILISPLPRFLDELRE